MDGGGPQGEGPRDEGPRGTGETAGRGTTGDRRDRGEGGAGPRTHHWARERRQLRRLAPHVGRQRAPQRPQAFAPAGGPGPLGAVAGGRGALGGERRRGEGVLHAVAGGAGGGRASSENAREAAGAVSLIWCGLGGRGGGRWRDWGWGGPAPPRPPRPPPTAADPAPALRGPRDSGEGRPWLGGAEGAGGNSAGGAELAFAGFRVMSPPRLGQRIYSPGGCAPCRPQFAAGRTSPRARWRGKEKLGLGLCWGPTARATLGAAFVLVPGR